MFFAMVAVGLDGLGESLIVRFVAVNFEAFASMSVLMLNQGRTITEALFATFVRACKRSLSCVHMHMSFQSLLSSECPAARLILASQGTLLVSAMMLGQFFRIIESLAARVVLAGEKELVCMNVAMLI